MPVYVFTDAKGDLYRREIMQILRQRHVQAKLRPNVLRSGETIEIAYATKERRYLQRSSGADEQLRNLGVKLICRKGNTVAKARILREVSEIKDNLDLFFENPKEENLIFKSNIETVIKNKVKDEKQRNSLLHILQQTHEIIIKNGLYHAIEEVYEQAVATKRGAPPPRVLLHYIQTLYFSGMPEDQRTFINQQIAPVEVEASATGPAAAAGIRGTGNFGAINFLQTMIRIFGADGGVLDGGEGSRLGGARRTKSGVVLGGVDRDRVQGNVQFGKRNLSIWNTLWVLYAKNQMPRIEGRDYKVVAANDGILVPFGVFTYLGKVLSEITNPNEAPEGFFFGAADDPFEMSEEETMRLGTAAINSQDGSFAASGEKIGRTATKEKALERLALTSGGEPVSEAWLRLIINYFGMSTTEKLERDIEATLRTIVNPNLDLGPIGDPDTYSLLFSALISQSPEELRHNIRQLNISYLIEETITDKILFERLRKVMFKPKLNSDGNPVIKDGKDVLVSRWGFAEFNRGAITIDVGTLPSLIGFYMDMIRIFEPSGETRDKFLLYLKELRDGGQLTQEQLAEIDAYEAELRNKQRALRANCQRIAGYNPRMNIENCQFSLNPEKPPILGARTDDYTLPPDLQKLASSERDLQSLQEIASGDKKPELTPYYRSRITKSDLGDHADYFWKALIDEGFIEARYEDERGIISDTFDGTLETFEPANSSCIEWREFLFDVFKNACENDRVLLFYYDPEGIKTLKLSGCIIQPNTVIGRNTIAVDCQLGTGNDQVVIAENGALIGSVIKKSVTHTQASIPNQLALTKKLEEVAAGRITRQTIAREAQEVIDDKNKFDMIFEVVDPAKQEYRFRPHIAGIISEQLQNKEQRDNLLRLYRETQEYRMPMKNGWTAVFTLEGNGASQALTQQLVQRVASANTEDQRTVVDNIRRLEHQLGIANHDRRTVDRKFLKTRLGLQEGEKLNNLLGSLFENPGDETLVVSVEQEEQAEVLDQLVGENIVTSQQRTRLSSILDNAHNLIVLDLNTGINKVNLSGTGIKFDGQDPSKVYYFSLHFEKQPPPYYIFMNREHKTSKVEVRESTAYFSRQPTGNAPIQDYDIPFSADIKKVMLAVFGGVTMKDREMFEDFPFFSRFTMRPYSALYSKAGDMAKAVQSCFRSLPAVFNMPREAAKIPVSLDTDSLAAVIRNHMSAPNGPDTAESLKMAIMHELNRQTPKILSQYIANALSHIYQQPVPVNQIEEILSSLKSTVACEDDQHSIRELYNRLGIGDRNRHGNAQRVISDIIKGFPLSETIFREYGLDSESLGRFIETIIQQFRMQEVRLRPPLDPDKTFNVSLDSAYHPVALTQEDRFNLD